MPKKITFPELEKEFKKGGRIYEAAQFDGKFWKAQGDAVLNEMKVRAFQSKQLSEPKHGSATTAMKPLKPKTIQARRRKGVSGFGATPEKSSLSDSGKMLRDMTYKLIKGGVRLFFKSQRSNDIAYYHNYRGTSPSERFFFYLDKNQLKGLKKRILNKFNKNLRRK